MIGSGVILIRKVFEGWQKEKMRNIVVEFDLLRTEVYSGLMNVLKMNIIFLAETSIILDISFKISFIRRAIGERIDETR